MSHCRTVGALIEELQKYPPEMVVLATWEGIYRGLDVLGSSDMRRFERVPTQAVVIDVEYKEWPYDFDNPTAEPAHD